MWKEGQSSSRLTFFDQVEATRPPRSIDARRLVASRLSNISLSIHLLRLSPSPSKFSAATNGSWGRGERGVHAQASIEEAVVFFEDRNQATQHCQLLPEAPELGSKASCFKELHSFDSCTKQWSRQLTTVLEPDVR